MLAVPVDESMVYADLKKTGVCLGVTGVGRVEQAGSRVEDLKANDPVLVLPKPAKFSSSHPIGTARTLLTLGSVKGRDVYSAEDFRSHFLEDYSCRLFSCLLISHHICFFQLQDLVC